MSNNSYKKKIMVVDGGPRITMNTAATWFDRYIEGVC